MIYIFDFGIPINNELVDTIKIRDIIIEELKDADAHEISRGCGFGHYDAQMMVDKSKEYLYIQIFTRIVTNNNIPISYDFDVTDKAYFGFYKQ